jgi:hypothetical protein
MTDCLSSGSTRYFYSGNQVGHYNHVGHENFVAGGLPGSGISAGLVFPRFFPAPASREPWKAQGASLTQALLDASWPFIDLVWIADVILGQTVFRVSNRNTYVEEQYGPPRFYEARATKAPTVSTTLGEWLNPKFEIGEVKLELNNRDGLYNEYLPGGDNYRQWIGAKIIIRVGFGEKFSNYIEIFQGFITPKQGVSSTETDLTLKFYDRFDVDNVEIPADVFSEINYPDIEEEAKGKGIPIIYGDWSEEVGSFGEIPAFCTNALEATPTEYVFKISETALQSIGAIFLHRGGRTSETPNGPVRFLPGAITLEPDKGQFVVPAGVIVMAEYVDVIKAKAGPASGREFITSENAETNFIQAGVQTGDVVFKTAGIPAAGNLQDLQYLAEDAGDAGNSITIQYTPGGVAGSEVVTVIGSAISVQIQSGVSKASDIKSAVEDHVAASELVNVRELGTGDEVQTAPSGPVTLTGGSANGGSCLVVSVSNNQMTTDGLAFNEGDEFIIQTLKYKPNENDRISLICTGKNIQKLSVNRLADAGLGTAIPDGLSVGLDRTYWFADNTTKKIHQVTLNDVLVQSIDFADVDVDLTEVGGLTMQTDGTLWIFDRPTSWIYRFIVEDGATGLDFCTTSVSGLVALLTDGRGLTIDEANFLYLVDNENGNFYRINPFSPFQPTLVSQWNRSAFDVNAKDVQDMAADVNQTNLCLVDRTTGKFYRISRTTGALIPGSDFLLTTISDTIDYPVGVSAAQDGTIFVLSRSDLSLFNYNEDATAYTNPGFIVRDLLQAVAGRLSGDFDLSWNDVSRSDLANFKGRLYVQERSKLMEVIHKFLTQFSASMFNRFGLLSLFHVTFSNFLSDGDVIREGDIIENSFKPSKEYNQYFNSATAEYRELPFSEKSTTSDTYISVSGSAAAKQEINRKFEMPAVYRRADMDKLMPLLVRLAAPEPEFVTMDNGFRLLFTQIMDFRRINFDAPVNPITGRKVGGRRFNLSPCFVRAIEYNLETMSLRLKVWSLDTTKFGAFIPRGEIIGGEDDKIVLTTLGTYGFISPIGTITGSGVDYITLEDVGGQDAETRTAAIVGLAWQPGYMVDLVNAETMEVEKTLTVLETDGAKVTFTEAIGVTVDNSVKNLAGFISDGHFLQYSGYQNIGTAQKDVFSYYGKPEAGYSATSSEETEDQKGGLHNFADGRQPYLLHPKDYTPS